MKKEISFLLCLLIVQFTFSQEVKFGEVSKEELQEKLYTKDSSANAAILYKKQSTYFNVNSVVSLVTETHERIKIYNTDGFDEATITINLFKSGSEQERVGKIKAYTYNLENGKVVKTKLEKDQIFKSEFSHNYNQIKFTMPNVKVGSVLEIEYKLTSPFYFNIDEFTFQYHIPVKRIEAELRTPEGYNFKAKHKGYLNFFPKRSVTRDHRVSMNVEVLNYSLEDVPALIEESFVDNINNYKAGVMFELVSILIPGSVSRYYSKTWGDVAKTIGSSDDYKNELDKLKSFDDILDNLLVDQTNDVDKMKVIYKYVKDNLKWNGIDGKYFYHGIRKALKEKKGNVGDVNLTLVAMLRYAGIDANPLIISTKDNLIPYFPTVDGLNYVVAYALIGGKPYFLDATDEFSDINLLPLKDYNWQGLLVDNNKMIWKKIDIIQPKLGVSQYVVNANIDDEGGIEGSLKSRFMNHRAYKFRENFKDQDLDLFITNKEERFESIEISNYQAENTDVYEGFVSESFDFYKESGAEIIDGKIYIQPLLFLKITENPFKLEHREYPIDFGYPMKDTYMVNISFPEGYTMESSPEPIVVKIPNNLGEFRYNSKVLGNKIQLTVSMELSSPVMASETYSFLKEFFNQMINKEKEQIVLNKV